MGADYALFGARLSMTALSAMGSGEAAYPLRSQAFAVPMFQEWKGCAWKEVSFHARRPRGPMTCFAVRRIAAPEGLKDFAGEGCGFEAGTSGATARLFRRRA